MDTKQLKEIVDNGGEIIVKFNNPEIGDYSFLDVGMMARLISIQRDKYDECWEFIFDVTEFDTYNTPLQRRDYYDSNQNPILTAKECGAWRDTEKLFIENDFTTYFDLVTNKLLQEYIDNKIEVGYVEWLENKVNQLRSK